MKNPNGYGTIKKLSGAPQQGCIHEIKTVKGEK